MIPCKLNHNMICLGSGLLSKGLGTNSKLLTNRNVQFHWNPPIGPLSQMALSMKQIIITNHHKKKSMIFCMLKQFQNLDKLPFHMSSWSMERHIFMGLDTVLHEPIQNEKNSWYQREYAWKLRFHSATRIQGSCVSSGRFLVFWVVQKTKLRSTLT
jgi:hypothetical protein